MIARFLTLLPTVSLQINWSEKVWTGELSSAWKNFFDCQFQRVVIKHVQSNRQLVDTDG